MPPDRLQEADSLLSISASDASAAGPTLSGMEDNLLCVNRRQPSWAKRPAACNYGKQRR